VDLQRDRPVRDDRGDDRALKRSGRDDDVARFVGTVRGIHPEARAPDVPFHRRHLDAAPDGRVDLLRVRGEVVRDPILAGEGIRIQVDELQAGKAVMPGRTVRHQRVPPL
jgi:hypothetical protein